MNDFWELHTETSSTPITAESLEAAFEAMQNQPHPPPHGTKEAPHIIAPREGLQSCIQCGQPMVVVKDGSRWRGRPATISDFPASGDAKGHAGD